MTFDALFEIYVQFFFLLTPFCLVSVFLSVTHGMDGARRRNLALRTSIAVALLVLLFFFSGRFLFVLFGITLDAFKIGAGAILFLTAISLATGKIENLNITNIEDLPVVPLAMPLTVGPGTIGALVVKSVTVTAVSDKLLVSGVLLASAFSVGILVYFSNVLDRLLGRRGIAVLSRCTGLIVAAVSAQLILDGIRAWMTALPS